ncbi:glycosyltransferase family 2 protein [bacterium]|nr:glycosyltransferase family 2 protein [candidate division CSSED10-310 bacterium]
MTMPTPGSTEQFNPMSPDSAGNAEGAPVQENCQSQVSINNPEGLKVAVIIPVFNEEAIIGGVLDAIPRHFTDRIIVIDDGSTDGTPDVLASRSGWLNVIRHEHQCYIGVSIRDGLRMAHRLGMDVVVIFAGNGKDDPKQIPRLLKPILENGMDYVQGSRYLEGGKFNKMPRHRRVVTRIYPLLLRLFTGFHATDGTNGYRSYRLKILDDPRIDIDQTWLDECLEYYLALRILQCGYPACEVPVSKIYPSTTVYRRYTKVRPGIGWMNRLKPMLYCGIMRRR